MKEGDLLTKTLLISSAKTIRDRYRALKRGRYQEEQQRFYELDPIVKPLQELVRLKEEEDSDEQEVVPFRPQRIQTPSKIPRLAISAPKTLEFGLNAAKYLRNYLTKDNITDTTYGIRTEGENKFFIGNKPLEIANDDLVIDGEVYKGTEGLWQLVTLKDPKDYTTDDLETYKEILIKTDAHKKGYNAEGAVSSNKHSKYKNIISRLFPKVGRGLNGFDEVDYDPNVLIDRWRHLDLLKQAGRGSVKIDDEVNSIIAQLLEDRVMELINSGD